MSYDIAVVGDGPAGLSAAVQGLTRGKSVVVISSDLRDNALYKARRVDNYLGFPQAEGAQLLTRFREHAEAMGAAWISGRVLNIMPAGGRFYLGVGSDMEEAGAVVLATGVVQAARLPGEAEHLGRGVSYCATCDGMLYRNRPVVVVGKSAHAPEEAAYLQGLGCRVTYAAARRPEELPPDIPFVKAGRLEIVGEDQVCALRADGEEVPCDGVFILRPTMALTDLLPGLETEEGRIVVDRSMATSIPGVFAAGDCTGLPHQVSKAVGEGQVAGHRASEYVDRQTV